MVPQGTIVTSPEQLHCTRSTPLPIVRNDDKKIKINIKCNAFFIVRGEDEC